MKFLSLSAFGLTLCLVVYLAPTSATAVFATGMSEAESARVEAYSANLLTPDEERIVGQRLAYLYEQRHTPQKDAGTQIRLNRIKARLSAVIPAQALDITIIKSAQPEAVSFPPGRIFISSSLVKLTPGDDELAAVIAHEAAHATHHHLTRLIALALVLPVDERENFPTRAAITTGEAAQFAFPTALYTARLRCEMEADRVAVRWLVRAGYRPAALATLLDNLNTRISPYAPQERAALQARIALLTQ